MDHRIIELSYDLTQIPGHIPDGPVDQQVLHFRDGAMAALDDLLGSDGLGYSLGAEFDAGRLRLCFVVMDFDAAEARILWGLDETPYSGVREILRYWEEPAVA